MNLFYWLPQIVPSPPITICIVERKLNKLFDSDEQVPKLPTDEPYAKIFYHASPNFQFEKLRLNELFKQCIEKAFFFRKKHLQQAFKSLFFKNYTKFRLVFKADFTAANWKSVRLEISSTNDKSNWHLSLYNSFNAEVAVKKYRKTQGRVIAKLKIRNTYSVSSDNHKPNQW